MNMKNLRKSMKQLDQVPMPVKAKTIPFRTRVIRAKPSHLYAVSAAIVAFAVLAGGAGIWLNNNAADPLAQCDETTVAYETSENPATLEIEPSTQSTTTVETAAETTAESPSVAHDPDARLMEAMVICHDGNSPMPFSGDRQNYVNNSLVFRTQIGENFTAAGFTVTLDNISFADGGVNFHFTFPNSDGHIARKAFFTSEPAYCSCCESQRVGTFITGTERADEFVRDLGVGFGANGVVHTRQVSLRQHYNYDATLSIWELDDVIRHECGNDYEFEDCECIIEVLQHIDFTDIQAFMAGDGGWAVRWDETSFETIIQHNNEMAEANGNEYVTRFHALEGLEGIFIHPLSADIPLTRDFGFGHIGLDFAAYTGTDVRAVAPGTVVLAKYNYGSYGHTVMIEHEFTHPDTGEQITLTTLYAHLNEFNVAVGDVVEQGQVIAQVGSTGRSTGPHLHFETSIGGFQRINPRNFFDIP
jgi:hypothetical protein